MEFRLTEEIPACLSCPSVERKQTIMKPFAKKSVVIAIVATLLPPWPAGGVCLTLSEAVSCMCGGSWFYPGCNDNLNGTSIFLGGYQQFYYHFGLTDAHPAGWDSISDFPTQTGTITCWSVTSARYYPSSGDCTGNFVELSPGSCTNDNITTYDWPPIEPECYVEQ